MLARRRRTVRPSFGVLSDGGDESEPNVQEDRPVVRASLVQATARRVLDRGGIGVDHGDVALANHPDDDVTHQDVINQLGLAAVDAGEPLIGRNQRCQIPQALAVALV